MDHCIAAGGGNGFGASGLLKAIDEWRSMRLFQSLDRKQCEIVFYSEGSEYWVHLEPIIHHLVYDFGRTVCYLSSENDDPGLAQSHPRILPFYIGDGVVRTRLFRELEATVMVMTMPDLETFHIKRSVHPVHYVYIFHAAVSTHMVYRKHAFDHFDEVFCVGPHHMAEIRRAEEVYALKPKTLVEHGYGRLDSILKISANGSPNTREKEVSRILIAPSWGGFGRDGLLEMAGGELISGFLDAGLHVTLRPHPMTRIGSPRLLAGLIKQFASHPQFIYEDHVASVDSLDAADLMVSDWSGAAFDFAYGVERPVLFIDIPRKVNNADYDELGIEPLEVRVRSEIGEVLAFDQLHSAAGQAIRLIDDAPGYIQRIRQSRARWIFNVGRSGYRGAKRIVQLCEELPV